MNIFVYEIALNDNLLGIFQKNCMSRKKIIILSSVFLFLAIIAFVVYFLAINRAESSLQKLVKNQSNGKLFLKVEKVDLDILDLRFDFQHLEIRSIDSSNTISGYHLKADNITFSVHSLISVLVGKHIIIDSVIIYKPLIEVIKYNEGPKRKISLPEEMSKVYHSLEKILEVLNLNYLHIADAKFRVFDRSKSNVRPLQVSNINLTIDNVTKANKAAEKKFLFADRILLEIYNENLVLPDGLHGISFKKLWLGTRSRMLILDSCNVYGKSNDSASASFSLSIDSLRILNFDFNRLAKDNTIKFDSALCINPQIHLNLHQKANGKKHDLLNKSIIDKDSVDHKLTKMLGNLDIGYLAVKNAVVNIITQKNNKSNTFNTQNSNFSICGLVVDAKNEAPLQVKEIKFDVHDYTGYSPDSLHMIQFNAVVIQENKIRLNDFRIQPTKRNHDPERKQIKMKAFELDDINWLALLYEHRIVAGHASLIQPEIDVILNKKNNNQDRKEKQNPFHILTKIQDKIKIGHFFVENGNVKVQVLNGPSVSMSNCYLGINVEQLLSSENEFRLINALDTLSFSKGEFHQSGSHYTLAGGKYSKTKSALYFKQIADRKNDKSQMVTIDNAKLAGILLNSTQDITVDELSWQKARIDIETDAGNKSETKNPKPASGFKFKLNRINGGPTQLSIKTQGIEAATVLNRISTGEIIVESGRKPSIKGLYIDGQSINLDQQDKLHGSFDQFQVADNKPSVLSNVLVRLPVNGETATFLIPRLTFSVDIQSSLNGKIKADFIELSQPVISFDAKQESGADSIQKNKKASGFPDLQINRITIDQPELVNLPASMQSKLQFRPGQTRIDLHGIHSESNELKIDSLSLSASESVLKTNTIQLIPADKSMINLAVTDIMFRPSTPGSKSKWALKLNALKLANLHVETYQNDTLKQSFVLGSMNVGNIYLDDSLVGNTDELLKVNNHFYINHGNVALKNNKTSLDVYNLSLNKSANTLTLDSLNFSPVMDRDSFMKTKQFQSTYLKFHSGKININGIDFARLLKDTLFYSPKIMLSDFHLVAYKDKRLPFRHGIVKPMLTDMLLNIKPKLQVDSVIFKKGLIEYEEFNDKTKQHGKIKLSKIKGAVADVRTFGPMPDDSLKFNMYARLIDTADIRLKYKQSYTDSLSGFNLKIIVSSFNLTALNPILRPFASAELKSGNLDTIRMSAIGRKYIAYGIMKMYYYDLNAQMLSKGDSSAKNIVTKSVSFFANRLVHTKNRRGTGDVFAERDPEKGFVNYWVKIVVGGVLTNSGVRTDKKQQRKYKRALNNHAVPPIPDIPVDY